MKVVKRDTAILIPYRVRGGEVEIYLQKRAKDAERAPECFGFFGGGVETGESGEAALKREIKEEMGFGPEGYELFKKYEFDRGTFHVFELEVGADFESRVEIHEGEYGKFLKEKEVFTEKIVESDRIIYSDFFGKFRFIYGK